MAESTTIARPYARAAFEAASESDGGLSRWSDVLAAAGGIAGDSAMRQVLGSPDQDDSFKAGLFLEMLGDRLDASGSNFIKLLAENGRLDILPEIAQVYEEFRAEAEKSIEAQVISAFEVTAEQQQKIAAALSKRLQREVALDCSVDPSLIAGAVIRAGDLVIDGSARGRIDQLATALRE